MSCNPAFVLRIDATPLSGSTVVWKASTRPFATGSAYEGLIRGRMVSFGDIRQAMSDRSGAPVVNSFECVIWDPDNYWRAYLADPNREYLTGEDVTVLFGSLEGIASELVALVSVFRGQLLDPSPMPGKQFAFSAESRLGTRKGSYDMASAVNRVTAQRAVDDGFTAVPRDSLEKRLPALWSEKTDKGTTNEFGVLIEKGACTGVNLGPLPGNDPVYLAKPTWGPYQKYSSGSPVAAGTDLGGHTYTYIFGARTTDGQWSLSDPLTITGLPAPENFSKASPTSHRGFGTGVELFGVPYTNADDLASITNPTNGALMGDLWVKDGASDSPSPYRHMDAVDGELFTIGYDDNGDDSHYKLLGPALPPAPLAQTNAAAGDFWCFLRHPGTITQGFVSDLGGGLSGVTVSDDTVSDELPAGSPAQYVPIPSSAIGTMVDLGPSDTGLEVTVNGHYYFGLVLSGALMDAARNGFPPRANLCGWADADGLVITQAAYIAQDVPVQMTGGPLGRGSEDGTHLAIPNFAAFPAVPIVQPSTFQAVQDITKAFLGTVLGYLGCVYFGPDDARTWSEHWQQVWIDWGFDRFENEHGQDAISVMDDTLSPDAGTLLRERIEIARVLDAGKVRSSEIQNLERLQYGWLPIEGTYRSGVQEIRNGVSIDKYGERGKGEGAVTNHLYTDDHATAMDAAARMLADRATGPSYPSVLGKLKRMIPIPLGRQYRIQHSDLITADPIPIYLRERVISPTGGTITLTGRSRPRGTFVARVADDAVPVWTLATPAERASVMFVSDEAGLLSDGSPAPRIR